MVRKLFALAPLLLFAGLLLGGSGTLRADDGFVYGRELMDEEEIAEHRRKMRTLSGEEREAYRMEHHERMQQRAREQGVTLPEEPMPRGRGMGRGSGPGGPGQGMGGGRRGPRGGGNR